VLKLIPCARSLLSLTPHKDGAAVTGWSGGLDAEIGRLLQEPNTLSDVLNIRLLPSVHEFAWCLYLREHMGLRSSHQCHATDDKSVLRRVCRRHRAVKLKGTSPESFRQLSTYAELQAAVDIAKWTVRMWLGMGPLVESALALPVAFLAFLKKLLSRVYEHLASCASNAVPSEAANEESVYRLTSRN
jgi:hypothetical protein